MKSIIFISFVILTGCVGSPIPHKEAERNVNPMKRKSTNSIWWRASTAGVPSSENPWEIYVPKPKPDRWDDPWGDYEGPPIFPEGWEPAKKKVSSPKERPINQEYKEDVF